MYLTGKRLLVSLLVELNRLATSGSAELAVSGRSLYGHLRRAHELIILARSGSGSGQRGLAGIDSLAYSQSGDVNVDLVRKFLQRSANLNLSYTYYKTTTLLYTFCISENVYRNCYLNRFVLRDSQEVDMDSIICNRIILSIVKDARMNLTVKVDVDDVRLWRVCNLLYVCQWNGDVRFNFETRDEPLELVVEFTVNAAALLFCLLQDSTHLIKLNPVNYFVSFVPVHVDWGVVLTVDILSFFAIMLLLLIPTLFISKVDPAETVRVR